MPLVLVNLLQSTGKKGGIEVYIRELYRHMGEVAHDFDFVGYGSREITQHDNDWFPGEIVESGISGDNRLQWAWGELLAVGRAANRLGADLIHGPAMFGPIHSKQPVVITVHDLLYFTHPQLMQTKLFTAPVKWMERRGVANATRLIAISRTTATTIERHLAFPVDHIDTILQAGRSLSRAVSTTPRRSDLFVAVGQRSPYKSFETILQAWSRLSPEGRPKLIITGSHQTDPLRSVVSELRLENSVELKSWVPTEQLAELFSRATAFIDATLAAGFGLPAVEAMQVGLPTLLADTEIFREVGADAAEYFRAGDPADLARAVMSLQTDPARLAELSVLGPKRASQFSWKRSALETTETFRSALAEGKRDGRRPQS
jgi:glycosyltransferase involved in cell wall biosynthesis